MSARGWHDRERRTGGGGPEPVPADGRRPGGEVLVPVDGTTSSTAAASWAARHAAQCGMALSLVHGLRWPVHEQMHLQVSADLTGVESTRAWARDMLAEVADHCRSLGAADVRFDVVDDDPVGIIADRAPWADLVVMGHSASGGAARLLLGSTAIAVISSCVRPVVVVRSAPAVDQDRVAGDGPVVVGADGSPSSARAVRFAYGFAACRAAEVEVVHVTEEDVLGADRVVDLDSTAASDLGDGVVGRVLIDCVRHHPDVTGRLRVVTGKPADVLLEAARDAQLVVVGNRARGPLRRALFGSTSEPVVDLSPAPVAVLSPQAVVTAP